MLSLVPKFLAASPLDLLSQSAPGPYGHKAEFVVLAGLTLAEGEPLVVVPTVVVDF